MTDLSIAQALFDGQSSRARSANFADDWDAAIQSLIRGFGQPPEAAAVDALFARPFGKDRVAIVQVRWPRFRVLVLGRELYHHLHDPFAIADRFPSDWDARGSLPELAWPPEPLPPRTLTMLDEVLKGGDSPFLLGASQTMVDGGKIVLERAEPDPKSIRDLWALLPDSVRRAIWPATFAYTNELGFDLLVLPKIPDGKLPGYLSEGQARDYPESRYERNLQTAIECGDEHAVQKLLARKSTNEMIRLALMIIAVALGIVGAIRVLTALRLL